MELSDLIESIDIVEYISQYTDLEEKNGEYWGLSVFKDEKTPSFSVRQDPPCFYDYSSGIAGNVYTFVRYYNKCSPKKAIEILKSYAGIEGDISSPSGKLEAIKTCKKFAKPKKREKVSKSTILQDDYMDRYDDTPSKLKVWEDEGISQKTLKKFQVKYDSFSNRLVYPIRDIKGRIVNIGGRTLCPDWKERKLRKYTYFFSWGKMATVYGLAENMEDILKKREVIIFEGAKSVMLADTYGINNTGALLTSHLNPEQLKIFVKLGCHVVFALDKEVDITKDHNINILKNYIEVEYIRDTQGLIDEKDSPIDRGKDIFLQLYEGRRRFR